jgi:hypothetical protein
VRPDDHLSLGERRVLRLAANRLAEKGQWDLEALKIEFEELIVLNAPVEITGFSRPKQITSFLATRRIVWNRGRSSPIPRLRSPG